MFNSTQNCYEFSYLRHKMQNETFNFWGSWRDQNGIRHYYRIGEDPENDRGIPIDATAEELKGLCFRGVHRGKVYFSSKSPSEKSPSVRVLREKAIVVEASYDETLSIHINDSSNFIHITRYDRDIHVLDITSLEFLPYLQIEGAERIWKVAGVVVNGEITVFAKNQEYFYLITAQLPIDDYGNNDSTNREMTPLRHEVKATEDASSMIVDNLVDQCCCSICSDNFDSVIPRVLDCGHTFCEICLYNDSIRVDTIVKCPNCSTLTSLPDGKVLPKNFAMMSMCEQILKTRDNPKLACKSCTIKFSSSSIQMCTKDDCSMFNQLICSDCTLDGGHAGHTVKYEIVMEKIHKDLREKVTNICAKVEEKKANVIDLSEQVVAMTEKLRKCLGSAEMPPTVIEQLNKIGS
ncbi:hypothetical protein PMAYCL1PPCAC_09087, partial [Pristionchus mayeri]